MDLQSAGYFLFLGLLAATYSLLAPSGRPWLLLAASLFFYACSSPACLALLLALSALNYGAVLSLDGETDHPRRAWVFGAVVTFNLLVLATFKYWRHGLEAELARAGWTGPGHTAPAIIVPLGISYFTFQMVACVTDAYRRDWRMAGGWRDFTLFALFFPQITSGPIPRAGRLLPQLLAAPRPTAEDRLAGLRLIAYGLFKKLVIANRLANYVTQIFEADDGLAKYSLLPTLLGCVYNTLALYADFSSYVDIARGSARFLGIHLDLNFDRPFTSTSVTEFWRRWHMTLSYWLRDYLYLPLLIRIRALGMTGVVLALIFTFAVCGVWHDATWTYLLFGVAQGVAMSVELVTKRWRTKRLKQWPARWVSAVGWLYVMAFFVLTEVLFRSASLPAAGAVYAGLGRFHLFGASDLFAQLGPFFFLLNLIAVAVWFPVAWAMRRETWMSTPWFVFACALLMVFLGQLGTGHFIYAGF